MITYKSSAALMRANIDSICLTLMGSNQSQYTMVWLSLKESSERDIFDFKAAIWEKHTLPFQIPFHTLFKMNNA